MTTVAPKWAQELVLDALLHLKHENIPTIKWYRAGKQGWGQVVKPRQSRGHTKLGKDTIVVTAGSSRLDQKLVLLHELAHHITQAWHTDTFWDTAWGLYRWAKLPIKYVKEREGNYKKGALVAYRRNLVRQKAKESRHAGSQSL